MRYVPVNQLKDGMILGQDIHDATGRLLIARYTTLTTENISYVTFLGVPGVYIDDEFSKDILVREVVRPEVRQSATRIIRETFFQAKEGTIPDTEQKIITEVQAIVDDVLKDDMVMYNLVELKTYDDYTYFHSVNVAILAGVIGAKAGLAGTDIEDLVTAGFLHDVGKVFIDPDILNAPRRLNEEERLLMMDHPRLGYEFLLKNYHFSENAVRAVYEHHEWWNGMGYPCHKEGKDILKISRILKAADVFDAMRSKRPYHNPYLPSEVMEYIMGRCGMEFDPDIVEIMVRELCVYPVGCEVELSDGSEAIVVENHSGYVLRPTVRRLSDGVNINLKTDRKSWKLTIVKLMM